MAGRVSQVVAEVMGGNGVTPSMARVSQVVVEIMATIGSAPPPPPPNPVVGTGALQGGGGKFFLARYNCYDCLLQVQQCMWDKLWCVGVKTCHPILTRDQKRRKLMKKYKRNL